MQRHGFDLDQQIASADIGLDIQQLGTGQRRFKDSAHLCKISQMPQIHTVNQCQRQKFGRAACTVGLGQHRQHIGQRFAGLSGDIAGMFTAATATPCVR